MSYTASLRVWRGDAGAGALADFDVEVGEGEVVLDVLHRLQATQATDFAIRWNCKAGKCDSCSMEINADRREIAQEDFGLGYCNITKCCTEVCPEHIKITDNALIPMKERVAGRKYDPLAWLGAKITRRVVRGTPAVPGGRQAAGSGS